MECPEGKALLISEDPFRDFNQVDQSFQSIYSCNSQYFRKCKHWSRNTNSTQCFYWQQCFDRQELCHSSKCNYYDNTVIGDHVTIHANTVLGADAFYYKNRPEGFDQLISGGKLFWKIM